MTANILVADDSTTVVKIVSLALRFKGYRVAAANNGKEALDALRREAFDMAIIDLMMPVMDGLELLSIIKKDDNLKDIPVIIFASEDDEESRKKSMELGADSYIAKPFQPQEIIAKVEALLND